MTTMNPPTDKRLVSYPVAYTAGEYDQLVEETPSEEPSPEEIAIAHEMEARMLAALDGRENRVFLNMLRGASTAEIAEIEEVSLRTAQYIVAEVRRKAAAAIGRVQ